MIISEWHAFRWQTGGGDLDDVPASQHWLLPNREFQGQWEYLYYEEDLKENVSIFERKKNQNE